MTHSVNSSNNELCEQPITVKESKEPQQHELTIQRLISTNEQLKVQNRMQKEFVNIAAHEIRTPIQPILGLTEALRSKMKDTEQLQVIDAVIRNAKRLQWLTEDLLDVTKIESDSLSLKKEKFNLIDLLSSCIKDYENHTY